MLIVSPLENIFLALEVEMHRADSILYTVFIYLLLDDH